MTIAPPEPRFSQFAPVVLLIGMIEFVHPLLYFTVVVPAINPLLLELTTALPCALLAIDKPLAPG